MARIRLANLQGLDAQVAAVPLRGEAAPELALPGGQKARFKRFFSGSKACSHEALAQRLGEDYGQALLEGDPEIDAELFGASPRGQLSTVWLGEDGEPLNYEPLWMESVTNPDGTEKERRECKDAHSNVNLQGSPLRISKKVKIPLAQAASRFKFGRAMQLRHYDGAGYEFLRKIAEELSAEECVYAVGAGAKGNEPLIFAQNGRPYRAFLEAQALPDGYILVLRLSDMELKKPAREEGQTAGEQG